MVGSHTKYPLHSKEAKNFMCFTYDNRLAKYYASELILVIKNRMFLNMKMVRV